MGDGLWPLFWAAAALMITGMAAWGSTMLMHMIDERIERTVRSVLDDVDRLEDRVERIEARVLPDVASLPELESPPPDEIPAGS